MSAKPKVSYGREARSTAAETWAFKFKDRRVTSVSCLDDPGEVRIGETGEETLSYPVPPPKMVEAINTALRNYPNVGGSGVLGDGLFIINADGGAAIKIRKGSSETCH